MQIVVIPRDFAMRGRDLGARLGPCAVKNYVYPKKLLGRSVSVRLRVHRAHGLREQPRRMRCRSCLQVEGRQAMNKLVSAALTTLMVTLSFGCGADFEGDTVSQST